MNGIPAGTGQFDGTTDRTLFISPFSIDPNNSSTLVAGTYRVWRTTNSAGNWSAISGDLTGDGTGSQGAKISTVIVAKGNSNVIYAGCNNGQVQVTDGWWKQLEFADNRITKCILYPHCNRSK